MILLMRNRAGESAPGCDYTAVRIDHPLGNPIAGIK